MKFAIPIIVLAELLGSSLWFSANGAAPELQLLWGLTSVEVGYLTSAVQMGFICGTLIFAVTGLADRYSASRIFTVCALLGAIVNAAFAFASGSVSTALIYRFLTGITLAGIYPVGMKLVVSWEPDKKGMALGWLVGMLTLGTALPHFIEGAGTALSWQWVVSTTSVLAIGAAVLVGLLGDGPHHLTVSSLNWGKVFAAFKVPAFRYACLGYFGHMWELYAFWTITPYFVNQLYLDLSNAAAVNNKTAYWSFIIIGIGAMGCVLGGHFSVRLGSARIALMALVGSGLMCLLYPLIGDVNVVLSLSLLLFWGFTVVADSPQFSALAASSCPPESIGSALAIMNSVGFFITILSIEWVTQQWPYWNTLVALILLPGPLLGGFYMWRYIRLNG